MKGLALLLALATVQGGAEPLDVRGVCDVRPDGADCWNLRGVRLPDLSRQVTRLAAGEDWTPSFRQGLKTRFLVARAGSLRRLYARSDGVGEARPGWVWQDGRLAWLMLRVSFPPDAREGTVQTTCGVGGGEAEMPFREGAVATVEGTRVEIARIEPQPPRLGFPGFPSEAHWRLVVSRDESKARDLGLEFEPLDVSGARIQAVDQEGRPVAPPPGFEHREDPTGGGWTRYGTDRPAVSAVQIRADFSTDGLFFAHANVDPARVARLRVRLVRREERKVGPFPLDPQPSGP